MTSTPYLRFLALFVVLMLSAIKLVEGHSPYGNLLAVLFFIGAGVLLLAAAIHYFRHAPEYF